MLVARNMSFGCAGSRKYAIAIDACHILGAFSGYFKSKYGHTFSWTKQITSFNHFMAKIRFVWDQAFTVESSFLFLTTQSRKKRTLTLYEQNNEKASLLERTMFCPRISMRTNLAQRWLDIWYDDQRHSVRHDELSCICLVIDFI